MDFAMNLIERLEKLRRPHYCCEDPWYSCPKHEDGCIDEDVGDECNCGADDFNKELESIILEVRKILEIDLPLKLKKAVV